MFTPVLVSVSLFILGGNLSNNKGKLEGTTWSSLAGPLRGQSTPTGSLMLEFTKDGKLTYDTPSDLYTGTYSLLAGDVVSWNFDRKLSKTGKSRHLQKCVVKKDGTLTVSDADSTSLDFEPIKDLPGSANKGKIEGTKWSSLAGVVKGQNIPAGTLKLEFTKDRKMTYTTPNGVYTGTYAFHPGDKVLWSFEQELGGSKTHKQKMVVNKNGTLTVSDSDGTSLDFERVKD